MTPAAFARIMDRAYCEMRPWSADEIADTLANPHVVFLTQTHGGLIAQIVAGECEILALATDPESQRTGVGSALMTDLIEKARAAHADRIFLDVASRNHAARAFYDAKGFAPVGTRRGYYTLRDGTKDDAVLLSRAIARGQANDTSTSHGATSKSG